MDEIRDVEISKTSTQVWYSVSYKKDGHTIEATLCTYSTDVGGMDIADYEIATIWVDGEEIEPDMVEGFEGLEDEIIKVFESKKV